MSRSFEDSEGGGDLVRSGVSAASDESILSLFRSCSAGALTALELSGFRGLLGQVFEYTPSGSLAQLSLRGCSGLVSLPLPTCPALTSLDLAECCGLTDSVLIAIGARCPALVELNLESCENFCDAAINDAIEAGGFRCLVRVNTRGCPLITSVGLIAIMIAGNGQLQELAVGFDRAAVQSLNLPTDLPLPRDDSAISSVWRWIAPVDTDGVATLTSGCSLAVLGECFA